MTRDEKIAKARELRDRKWTYNQIGDALGVANTTARRWIDPQAAEDDRRRSRAMKERYRGRCETCGGPTNGADGPGTASAECIACFAQRLHDERRWTPETVIAAIRRWVTEYGFVPHASDWNPSFARAKHYTDAAERTARYESGDWPSTVTVQREYGTWNAAIAAAGFSTCEAGGSPGFSLRRAA